MTREAFGPSARQSLEHQLELQVVPEDIVDHLRFPVKDYGFKSYDSFKNSIKKSLSSKDPQPHIVVLMGEPNSGKSRFKRRLAKDLKHENTIELNWGDFIKVAKVNGVVPIDANYEDLGEKDMKELTAYYGEFVASILDDYQGQNVLFFAEIPAVVGAYIGQRFYGIDMGTRALWDLARRTGPFKGKKFKDYWAGMGASADVRKKAKAERAKFSNDSDPRYIQEVLEEGGNVIGSNKNGEKDKELVDYAQESPNAIAIDKIERSVDRFINDMAGKKLLSELLDWDRFLNDESYREEIIVGTLIKTILRDSIRPKKPSRSVLIADNWEKLPSVDFKLDVPILNIATYLYPEIRKIKNKGNKEFAYAEQEAEAYERTRGVEKQFIDFLLHNKFIIGSDFLDAGCGTGNDLAEIAKRTQYRGYGCDASPSMLSIARFKNAARDLELANLDREGIPFDISFSCIYAHDVVHHLSKPDVFINDAYQHLKNGGNLIIGTESESDIRQKITSVFFPGALEEDLGRYHSVDQLEIMMRKSGFNSVQRFTFSFALKITPELLDIFRAKGYSVLHKIDEKSYQEGLKEIDRYLRMGVNEVAQSYTILVAKK